MIDVIVTGGRDYEDWRHVKKVLDLFDIGFLIQGGAPGADYLAREYARERGIECITVEADWILHGRAAGPIRNGEMLAKYPNALVIAFPGGRGTEDCVGKALRKNRLVFRAEQKS